MTPSAPEQPLPADYAGLVTAIRQAHEHAQREAVHAANAALTLRNWLIGHYIVEYEQQGRDRAEYGEQLLAHLARDLRNHLGRGFSERYLRLCRQFYGQYPIWKSLVSEFGVNVADRSVPAAALLEWQDDAYVARLFRELPWTHFIELIRMEDPLKRAFYEVEALKNRWSVRELRRQIGSLLFERVGLSRDREGVLARARGSASSLGSSPRRHGDTERFERGLFDRMDRILGMNGSLHRA
jgi:hypothetical protein